MRVLFAMLMTVLTLPAALLAEGPSADEAARKAFAIMAGEAWDNARYMSFTFNVERDGKLVASFSQRWDRFTGQYRVSGKQRDDGREFVIVMDVDTKLGRAWLGGTEVTEPKELLERGYKRYINDIYWLLMPLKMLDPGVRRTLAGTKSDEWGRTWDVVKLTFGEGVGLTSGDQYWAWVEHESGIVDRWEMLLQGSAADEKPTVVKFRNFRRVGGLLISTLREEEGKGITIRLDDVRIERTVPAGAFDVP